MKDSGIMRRVDSLGRFVLPKELRRQLQIECNDYLQIYTEGEKSLSRRHSAAVLFADAQMT
ncbi:MAG: AbrB/MazE/SpoVT family DNA-binding domain-containing protein [Ruminococcus callidus]